MRHIALYDPPLCCESGVCGPEVDPVLPQMAAFLHNLAQRGVTVERYNLAQQPLPFVQNPDVKKRLDSGGMESLPLLYIDGELRFSGRYPTREERAKLARSLGQTPAVTS